MESSPSVLVPVIYIVVAALMVIVILVGLTLYILQLREERQDLRQKRMQESLRAKQDNEALKQKVSELERDRRTNVYRREVWEDKVRHKLLSEELVICIVDLDRLKHINDTYGHVYGDKVIELLASNLRIYLRNEDLIARYGGDEFVVALEHTSVEEVPLVFNRVLSEFKQATNNFFELELKVDDECFGFSYGAKKVDRGRRDLEPIYIEIDKKLYDHKRERKLLDD